MSSLTHYEAIGYLALKYSLSVQDWDHLLDFLDLLRDYKLPAERILHHKFLPTYQKFHSISSSHELFKCWLLSDLLTCFYSEREQENIICKLLKDSSNGH